MVSNIFVSNTNKNLWLCNFRNFFILSFLTLTSFAANANGTWVEVKDATIQNTAPLYKRGLGYYIDSSVAFPDGYETSEQLRIVVLRSSFPVTNEDGTMQEGVYFDLASLEEQTRIVFQPRRARLAVELAVFEFIANDDADEDGIPDEDDICPNDATNTCITISGSVFGGGAAIEMASITIGNSDETFVTDMAGEFIATAGGLELADDGLSAFFPVSVNADGFSSGYTKVVYESGQTTYEVIITVQQVSDSISESDDLNEGVSIVDGGAPVGILTIPTSALPENVTQITGDITYLDPESDDILPTPGGDLLALPEGNVPNEDSPVSLETFGMMEFDLKDQNGNEVHQLNGMAEVCMRAPSTLSLNETVPLWYYDDQVGLWIEEGEGTVVERDGMLQICGEVSHFSWWNYDRPISTHGCMHFDIQSIEQDTTIDGLIWQAEATTYSGTSPSRACDTAERAGVDTITVKLSENAEEPEKIRLYALLGGTKFYLSTNDNETYALTQNRDEARQFSTPSVNGSCVSGSETGSCLPLDHETDADGIILLSSEINFPPVITDFSVSDFTLFPGDTSQISVFVVDPEGTDLTVSWDYYCTYYGSETTNHTLQSVTNNVDNLYEVIFSADQLNGAPLENCHIEVTAIDADGTESKASRWLTIAASLQFEISGTIYNTDGQPLANSYIEYNNWACGDSELSRSVPTDENGEYQLDLDLENCFEQSEFSGFNIGYLQLEYQKGDNVWIHGVYLNDIAYVYQSGFDELCSVQGSGTTVCNDVDIRLPTLWTSIYGSYFPENELTNSSDYGFLEIHIGEQNNLMYSYNRLSLYDIEFIGSEVNYGPIQIPFTSTQGYNQIYIWDGVNWTNRDFNNYSIASKQVDIAPGQSFPVTINVFEPNVEDVVFDNLVVEFNQYVNGLETVLVELDASRQAVIDSAYNKASIRLEDDIEGYLAYREIGGADTIGEEVVVDFFSDDMCSITGTAFDYRGEPMSGVDLEFLLIQGYYGEQVISTTDVNGQYTFSAPAGRVYLQSVNQSIFNYWYSELSIDNCRPENGINKTIQFDLKTGDFTNSLEQ